MAPERVGPARSGRSRWRPPPGRRRRESARQGPTGRAAGGKRLEGRRRPGRPGRRRPSRRQRNGRAGGARAHPGREPMGGRRGASAGTRRAQPGTGGVKCARGRPRQAARREPRGHGRRGRSGEAEQVLVQRQALAKVPVPDRRQGRSPVSEQREDPRVEPAPGPGRGPGHRGRGRAGQQEAGPEDDAVLRDQGTEGHAEPGDFGGPGRAAEGRKRRPCELNCVRVCKQGPDGL
jgi:hypothetical protein